jgi:hypothetical protein
MGGYEFDDGFEGDDFYGDDGGSPGQRPTLTGLPAWADNVIWLAIIAAFAWLGFRQGTTGRDPSSDDVCGGTAPLNVPRDEHGFRESDLDTIAEQYAKNYAEQAPPTSGYPPSGRPMPGPLRSRGVGSTDATR